MLRQTRTPEGGVESRRGIFKQPNYRGEMTAALQLAGGASALYSDVIVILCINHRRNNMVVAGGEGAVTWRATSKA